MFLRKVILTFAAASLLINTSYTSALAAGPNDTSQSDIQSPKNNDQAPLAVIHSEIDVDPNSPLNSIDPEHQVVKIETFTASASTPEQFKKLEELNSTLIDENVKTGGPINLLEVNPDPETDKLIQESLKKLSKKPSPDFKLEKYNLPVTYREKFASFQQTMREYFADVRQFDPTRRKSNIVYSVTKLFFITGTVSTTEVLFSHVPLMFAVQFSLSMAAMSAGITFLNEIVPWNMSKNKRVKDAFWFGTEGGFLLLGREVMKSLNALAISLHHTALFVLQNNLSLWLTALLSWQSQGNFDTTNSLKYDIKKAEIDDELLGVVGKEAEHDRQINEIANKRDMLQFISSIVSVTIASAKMMGITGATTSLWLFVGAGMVYKYNYKYHISSRLVAKAKEFNQRVLTEDPTLEESNTAKLLKPVFTTFNRCRAALADLSLRKQPN